MLPDENGLKLVLAGGLLAARARIDPTPAVVPLLARARADVPVPPPVQAELSAVPVLLVRAEPIAAVVPLLARARAAAFMPVR